MQERHDTNHGGPADLHLSDTLKHPSISACMGHTLFCPWCFKLDGNMETIATHLCEVHYQMTIVCDICWVFACMTVQNIQDHWSECKLKSDKEHEAHEVHHKIQRSQDQKKESKSQRLKKESKLQGQK